MFLFNEKTVLNRKLTYSITNSNFILTQSLTEGNQMFGS